jgi:hypothetical protein
VGICAWDRWVSDDSSGSPEDPNKPRKVSGWVLGGLSGLPEGSERHSEVLEQGPIRGYIEEEVDKQTKTGPT